MPALVNTPHDFTNGKLIGKDIDLLTSDKGYDINFILDSENSLGVLAAELYEPLSGRLLKVFIDQPGMQVYTANWWDGAFVDQLKRPNKQHGAVALETQAFPGSHNHAHFPDTLLRPGQVYQSTTTYQFLTI